MDLATRLVPAAPTVGRDPGPIDAAWLGRRPYRDVWQLQKDLAAARAADEIGDRLLLVEHEPVLTLGRHADPGHVLATPGELARRGIEVIRVERGGEVTYHGPGQLVAYPIIALSPRSLLVRPLVRALEGAMVETCAAFGVTAARRDGHPGCWIDPDGARPRKVGALGIRVERGVSYHGIALNVGPDLAAFDLIDPCGMPGLVSTSIEVEAGRLGELAPTEKVEATALVFARAFAARLGVDLSGFAADGRPMAPPERGLVGADARDVLAGV